MDNGGVFKARPRCRVAYVSASTVPSEQASAVNVVHMSNAIADLGHFVDLYAYVPQRGESGSLETYGIMSRSVRLIGTARPRQLPDRVEGPVAVLGLSLKLLWQDLLKPYHMLIGRNALPLLIMAVVRRRRIVYEMHGISNGRLINGIERALLNAQRTIKVVAISEVLRQDILIRYGLEPDSVITLHDGAVPQTGKIPILAREGGHSRDGFCVGLLATAKRGKGHEIVAALAARLPLISFHVIGARRQDYLELIGRPPTENIHFHGYIAHAETAHILGRMDVLLAPIQRDVVLKNRRRSNIGRWTSPLKLFEYMAVQAPIVASRVPTVAEVLTDGESALLCDPESPGEWEQALIRLRDDAELRLRLAERAYELLVEEYSWTQRAQKLSHALECGN